MRRFLVVVDMQKDFVDGSLGTKQAVDIVPNVVEKIKGFCGDVFVTYDTHFSDYLETAEGKKLPVKHCIKGTEGWKLNERVSHSLEGKKLVSVEKPTFASVELPHFIEEAANGEDFSVELVGLCTDICVVSNALLLKASFPEKRIIVDASCCAGVTPETHSAAITTMRMCQIEV